MNERLDAARRLELSGVAEVGGHIEGTFRGVKLILEDHGLDLQTVKLDLGVPARWETIGPHHELNDPDVVQTGDSDFDLAITIVAEDGAEPTVRGIFDTKAIREAVRTFFERYPHARIHRGTLTLPHVAPDKAQMTECLDRGTKLILGLREAIAASPTLPREAPPFIQPPEVRFDVVYLGGMLTTVLGFALLPRDTWYISFALGVVVSALLYWASVRRW